MYDTAWSSQLEMAFEKARQRENVTNGRRANEKGHVAEERCLECVKGLMPRFPWIYHARLANAKEDARGFDVVVETDIGKLYLQVKSSHFGARKYRRKRPHAKAIIIVIPSDMSDRKLLHTITDRLGCLRKYFKQLRQKS